MKKKIVIIIIAVFAGLSIAAGIFLLVRELLNNGNANPGPVAYKPVIYIYPEVQTDVEVKIDYAGTFLCTYPAYNDGWKVTAMPDGTLADADGMEYNYLFWEGTGVDYTIDEGFCVKGSETGAFLEEKLEQLGLNRKEANEFIVYWLPKMQDNAWNLISFAGAQYTDSARLEISPAPDSVIRVFMVWKATDEKIEITEQTLITPERNGFTVVEWGGSEL